MPKRGPADTLGPAGEETGDESRPVGRSISSDSTLRRLLRGHGGGERSGFTQRPSRVRAFTGDLDACRKRRETAQRYDALAGTSTGVSQAGFCFRRKRGYGG